MTARAGVGILGMGVHLPKTVRTNDAWPAEVVAKWTQRLPQRVSQNERTVETMTDGVRLALRAMETFKDDPFQGARERRVMAPDETSSSMAGEAAKTALARAGVAPGEIDVLLAHSMVPDYMCVNNASIIHDLVGLRPEAMGVTVDSVCASLVPQLLLAQSLVASGQARHALLTQACACTRIVANDQAFSTAFGDAASALVIGPVPEGHGLLSTAFRSDGRLAPAFVATVPDRKWYEDGRVVACSADKTVARRMQLQVADFAREVVDEAISKADVEKRDIAFFACHQPTAWLPRVCQEHCGLEHARMIPTFAWTGNVSNVNLPIQLFQAQREGVLRPGDLVVLFGVSAGLLVASAVLRWA